jgi:hypothetical protein
MECKFLNWKCAGENVGPLFSGIIPWIKKYIFSLTFVLILFSIALVIFGRIFDNDKSLLLYGKITYDIAADSATTVGSAILSGIVVKYLISGNFFAKAISNVIIEKFSTYEFIKDFNEKKVREIVKSIVKAHPLMHIEINEEEIQKKKSIKKLEKYYNDLKTSISEKEKQDISLNSHEKFIKNKNYIVMESNDRRTVYRNGLELIDKKYEIKIMEKGNFLFEYKFQPQFSMKKDLVVDDFGKTNNRFSEYSYSINEKFKQKSTGKKRQNYKIHSELKVEVNEEISKPWFVISFSRKNCLAGDTINLDFSLSLPDEFREEIIPTIKEDTDKSPKTTFAFPHAYRTIMFQKEIYCDETDCFLSTLEPTLLCKNTSNSKELDADVSNNLFYKVYEWRLSFIEDDITQLTLTFE